MLPFDVALKRNDDNWFHDIAVDVKKDVLKVLTVGHFFCLVFHREYVIKKGINNNTVKNKILRWFDEIGAKYPAEHNVGHVYEADDNLRKFYRKLDPCNIFNPGIGKTSKTINKPDSRIKEFNLFFLLSKSKNSLTVLVFTFSFFPTALNIPFSSRPSVVENLIFSPPDKLKVLNEGTSATTSS